MHLHRLFLGSRRITDALQDSGHPVDRKHVLRLMVKMRIHGVCPNPNLSKAN
ncbi:MAG TPA: transposase [Gammaproteobacteria bacterium]|nr:transposase [Gammaproteobacteria bacterium]